MVWKTSPEDSMTSVTLLLDLIRMMASFYWQDPGLKAHPPEGWRLEFLMERSTDGYLVLTLWPSLQGARQLSESA